jgi:DNA polymerase I-like protein with 3'-5' exonuclease and polymerase domains
MTQEEARQFIQAFEASFPKVKEYVRETIQHVRLQGFAHYPFKRGTRASNSETTS